MTTSATDTPSPDLASFIEGLEHDGQIVACEQHRSTIAEVVEALRAGTSLDALPARLFDPLYAMLECDECHAVFEHVFAASLEATDVPVEKAPIDFCPAHDSFAVYASKVFIGEHFLSDAWWLEHGFTRLPSEVRSPTLVRQPYFECQPQCDRFILLFVGSGRLEQYGDLGRSPESSRVTRFGPGNPTGGGTWRDRAGAPGIHPCILW